VENSKRRKKDGKWSRGSQEGMIKTSSLHCCSLCTSRFYRLLVMGPRQLTFFIDRDTFQQCAVTAPKDPINKEKVFSFLDAT